jgi:hypothetical protein
MMSSRLAWAAAQLEWRVDTGASARMDRRRCSRCCTQSRGSRPAADYYTEQPQSPLRSSGRTRDEKLQDDHAVPSARSFQARQQLSSARRVTAAAIVDSRPRDAVVSGDSIALPSLVFPVVLPLCLLLRSLLLCFQHHVLPLLSHALLHPVRLTLPWRLAFPFTARVIFLPLFIQQAALGIWLCSLSCR